MRQRGQLVQQLQAELSISCDGGVAAEFGANGVENMAKKVTKEGVPLGSNSTTGCSLSLSDTGGNFEKTRVPIDAAVGKHDAEVRDV
eukprot:3201077-Pleurochrysis_carterae.AAC.1